MEKTITILNNIIESIDDKAKRQLESANDFALEINEYCEIGELANNAEFSTNNSERAISTLEDIRQSLSLVLSLFEKEEVRNNVAIAELSEALGYIENAMHNAGCARNFTEGINDYSSVEDVLSSGENASGYLTYASDNLDDAEESITSLLSSLQKEEDCEDEECCESETEEVEEETNNVDETQAKLLEIKEELQNLSLALQNIVNEIEGGN